MKNKTDKDELIKKIKAEDLAEAVRLDDNVFCLFVESIIEYSNPSQEAIALFLGAMNRDFEVEKRAELLIKGLGFVDSIFVYYGLVDWINSRKQKPRQSTVERACKMIQGRANVGQVKYGVSIDRDDLTASKWAQHAIEEMLDGAQYLIRLKDEMEALQKENAELKLKLEELTK
jgi:hypothetical protein